MRARSARVAVLAATLGGWTAVAAAAPDSPGLRPGLWKGEAITRVGGGSAAASAVMAIAGRIPLTKCISPELASKGPVAVLRDSSDCDFKVSGQEGNRISADQICRDQSGKEGVSKLVIETSREKLLVTITGEAPTAKAPLPMTVTDTLTWVAPSCG